jgi:ankyrin repeat protein
MIDCALRLQAPWLEAARMAPREPAQEHGFFCDVERSTSLMRAADAGDERRVRELLAAGAPLCCVDGERRTALHFASRRGDACAVVALLEADATGATVNALDREGCTPLFEASLRGHESVVRALLARGARQELQDRDSWAVLHHAAKEGHAGVVELLCAVPGAGVDQQTRNGVTPLILASSFGHQGAVRALLARDARQELQDSNGRTALHSAASNGYHDVVQLLCAAPGAAAALVLRDGRGRTPLFVALLPGRFGLATTAGRAACVAVLRAHGAS